MPGQPVLLGPFAGGLNTQSDPSVVGEQELVDVVNFEVDLDGSLRSRPPVVEIANTPVGSRMLLLGFANLMEGTYLIGSSAGGIYQWQNNVWNLITNTIQCTEMVQYLNKVWLPANPGSANPGGWWHPTNGFNPIAAMPQGQSILAHKGRLYIAPGLKSTTNRSRIYFSGTDASGNLDSTVWNTTDDVLDVNPGDGEILIQIIVFNDSIISLKQNSTYVFSFDTSPKAGVIRKLSGVIGVTRDHCAALYENNLYIYHKGEVYEVVNFDFARINTKVPFIYDATSPGPYSEDVFISFFGDRLIVRYYNNVYVFGMRTRTWTRWNSSFYFGPILPAASEVTSNLNDRFYAGSAITSQNRMFQMNDGFDAVNKEEMTCYAKTKNYDMGTSSRYKRLFYWGADLLSVDDVSGTVTPVLVDLQDIGITAAIDITSNPPPDIPARTFVKFLKSLRFRQVNFRITMTTDGSLSRGPVRLFGLTAFVRLKEHTVKAAS